MTLLQIIFWSCFGLLCYTYLLYPGMLILINRLSVTPPHIKTDPAAWPEVSVLIAAYNEEAVIGEKILSLMHSDYPEHRLEVWVGSDASTDNTNRIIRQLSAEYSRLYTVFFENRTGKPGVINLLAERAGGEILVITDANVLPSRNTLKELMQTFANGKIGLADTRMVNTGQSATGISLQEKTYISGEVQTKSLEGKLWGTMMGPFGGFYAIRKKLYRPVPSTFLVDDFYLCLTVLAAGYKSVSNTRAVVYEDVSNDLHEEIRRKTRISTGNFQNLHHFRHLLWPPWCPVAYTWWSHKVLRWKGPFLLLLAWAASLALSFNSSFYLILFSAQSLLPLMAIIDSLLNKNRLHFIPLRFITHFYAMNMALLKGFLQYVRGVHTNIWQPTRRFQVDEQRRDKQH